MSQKKKKPTPTGKKENLASSGEKTSTPVVERHFHWYDRVVDSGAAAWWRQVFWALSAVVVLLTGFLATRAGVNADDRFQVEYSERLTDYFLSFGKNQEVFYEQDEGYQQYVKYYGGAFEIFAGGINRLLGNDSRQPAYHQVRHLVNGAFALLLIFTLAFWARDLGGYRAAALALVLVLGSPRLLGHGVMNPKDIPFAAGYLLALYFLYRCLRTMPRPTWRDGLGFVLGAALATGQRAGGLLLFAYAGLFLAIDFMLRYGLLTGLVQHGRQVLRYALYWLGASLLAFGIALLVWPYAMQDPIAHTQEALKVFSNFGVRISVLYGGETMFSDAIPRAYPFVWMGITLSLSVLLGALLAVGFSRSLSKHFSVAALAVLWFSFGFPLVYLTLKDSALYDGWRQLMFVYPSLLLLATLAWELALRLRPRWQWGVLAVLLLGQADATAFSLRNPGYPYVYFNPLVGGINGAHGYYETDYWAVSARAAVEWLENEGILHPGLQDTLVIGTSFQYNVERQLDPSYRNLVKVKYVRFNTRYQEDWQYGIFPNRFIRGPQLRTGHWPNSKTVYTVAANGAPLAALEKNNHNYAYLGEKAMKENDPRTGAQQFQAELREHPDNELAWLGLASAFIGLSLPNEALGAVDSALVFAPDNETGLYFRGYAQLAKGDAAAALNTFNYLLKISPENATAYYFLAEIYRRQQQPQEALRQLEKAITYNPKFKSAYLLVGQIMQEQGNATEAARYLNMAEQLGGN